MSSSKCCFQVPTKAAGTICGPVLALRKVAVTAPDVHSMTSWERMVSVWCAAGRHSPAGTLVVTSLSPKTMASSSAETRTDRPMHSRSPVTWTYTPVLLPLRPWLISIRLVDLGLSSLPFSTPSQAPTKTSGTSPAVVGPGVLPVLPLPVAPPGGSSYDSGDRSGQ